MERDTRPINTETFMNKLGETSVDLYRFVQEVRRGLRLHALYTRSRADANNIFTRDGHGRRKYHIPAPKNRTVNILDGVTTPAELGRYLAGIDDYIPELLEAGTLLPLPDTYSGPKLRILKDANMIIEMDRCCALSELEKQRFVIPDVLHINKCECQRYGLQGRFDGHIPEQFTRVSQIVKRRLPNLTARVENELNQMESLFETLFEKESEGIMSFSRTRKELGSQDIAREYARDLGLNQSQSYINFVQKIIDAHRHELQANFIPDRVLTMAAFALNIADDKNKTIVVSDDKDLTCLFEFFYQKVLPIYVGQSLLRDVMAITPDFELTKSSREKLSTLAYKQVFGVKYRKPRADHSDGHSPEPCFMEDRNLFDKPLAVGLLYVPYQRRFCVKHIEASLRDRIRG